MDLRKYGASTNDSVSRRILRIFVESAALYSVNHLLYAVLYEVKSQIEITPSFLVSLPLKRSRVFHDEKYTNRKQV
jgi:hypothetical protein